jgi:NADPH:quinone reductase-like Zn-dependent oxidoreductase
MVINGFGGPEVFEEAEVPKPSPGPTQLLVKVLATSVNPVDFKIRRDGYWANLTFPAILGWDVSGVVMEVGAGVVDFKPGDEVFYNAEIGVGQGTYAEYHVAEAAIVAPKPKNVSHLEAAGIPLAGGTAYEGVVTRARLMVGETALIHAAAGGVGMFAVQIAKAAGAYVFGTCRAENAEFVKGLGVDRVIDYKTEDYVEVVNAETGGAGVEFVYDTVGGDTITRSVGCTKNWGRIVSIVAPPGDSDGAGRKNITIHYEFSQRYRAKMEAMRIVVERGQMRPVTDSVMPLTQVAEAHRRLEAGGVRGKIVLDTSK